MAVFNTKSLNLFSPVCNGSGMMYQQVEIQQTAVNLAQDTSIQHLDGRSNFTESTPADFQSGNRDVPVLNLVKHHEKYHSSALTSVFMGNST